MYKLARFSLGTYVFRMRRAEDGHHRSPDAIEWKGSGVCEMRERMLEEEKREGGWRTG